MQTSAQRSRGTRVPKQHLLRVTISAGYASLEQLPKELRTADDLLRTADERLYRSKQAGRNRVTGA